MENSFSLDNYLDSKNIGKTHANVLLRIAIDNSVNNKLCSDVSNVCYFKYGKNIEYNELKHEDIYCDGVYYNIDKLNNATDNEKDNNDLFMTQMTIKKEVSKISSKSATKSDVLKEFLKVDSIEEYQNDISIVKNVKLFSGDLSDAIEFTKHDHNKDEVLDVINKKFGNLSLFDDKDIINNSTTQISKFVVAKNYAMCIDFNELKDHLADTLKNDIHYTVLNNLQYYGKDSITIFKRSPTNDKLLFKARVYNVLSKVWENNSFTPVSSPYVEENHEPKDMRKHGWTRVELTFYSMPKEKDIKNFMISQFNECEEYIFSGGSNYKYSCSLDNQWKSFTENLHHSSLIVSDNYNEALLAMWCNSSTRKITGVIVKYNAKINNHDEVIKKFGYNNGTMNIIKVLDNDNKTGSYSIESYFVKNKGTYLWGYTSYLQNVNNENNDPLTKCNKQFLIGTEGSVKFINDHKNTIYNTAEVTLNGDSKIAIYKTKKQYLNTEYCSSMLRTRIISPIDSKSFDIYSVIRVNAVKIMQKKDSPFVPFTTLICTKLKNNIGVVINCPNPIKEVLNKLIKKGFLALNENNVLVPSTNTNWILQYNIDELRKYGVKNKINAYVPVTNIIVNPALLYNVEKVFDLNLSKNIYENLEDIQNFEFFKEKRSFEVIGSQILNNKYVAVEIETMDNILLCRPDDKLVELLNKVQGKVKNFEITKDGEYKISEKRILKQADRLFPVV
ncbi:hypothetical protein HDU92_008446 [Lobulomyces angularis]|nr:hypothetical protein HDU92_008446 [Lobulomyces angularis]